MDTELKPCEIVVNIDNYRRLVKHYMHLHLYGAALYWADKVVALSKNDPNDVYWMAQCMYLQKQYHRAAHLIRSRGLEKIHLQCHYLTIKSLFEAGELTEALQTIDSADINTSFQNTSQFTKIGESIDTNQIFDETPRNQVQAAILSLKGRIYEALDNRGMARDCYRNALQLDVYCYDAFEALIQHQMLTSLEETELLESLPVYQQCTQSEAYVLKYLYEMKLRKYHSTCKISENESLPFLTALSSSQHDKTTRLSNSDNVILPRDTMSLDISIPMNNILSKNVKIQNLYNTKKTQETKKQQNETVVDKLQRSLDKPVSVAEKYYYNCQYTYCIKITEGILKEDPFHSQCLPVHIACLVDLKESNKLFYLAHRLVALYPDLAISWFAVGCYYYVIGKSDPARRYLSKATTLDRLFGPAWLAYGHSFAIENEHDQAMAAYFKASQLMKGCHLPLLYIGLECGLTNNERLAEKFFQQAKVIAPEDPFVMHEMGVIAFQNLDYKTAEKHFRDALARVNTTNGSTLVEKWEPLLNNLGHTCRKRKKYHEALEFHKQALTVAPQNAATYSALGYVQALLGRTQEAVESFHKALGLRKNDTFSITMLRLVVDELLEETPPFVGAPDHIPDFDMISSQKTSSDRTLSDISGIIPTSPDNVAATPSVENSVMNDTNTPSANNTCLNDMSMSFD